MKRILLSIPLLTLFLLSCGTVESNYEDLADNPVQTRSDEEKCPHCEWGDCGKGLDGSWDCEDKHGNDPDPGGSNGDAGDPGQGNGLYPDRYYDEIRWHNSYPVQYKVTVTVFNSDRNKTRQITNVRVETGYCAYVPDLTIEYVSMQGYQVNGNNVTLTMSGNYTIYTDGGPQGESGWESYPISDTFTVTVNDSRFIH